MDEVPLHEPLPRHRDSPGLFPRQPTTHESWKPRVPESVLLGLPCLLWGGEPARCLPTPDRQGLAAVRTDFLGPRASSCPQASTEGGALGRAPELYVVL